MAYKRYGKRKRTFRKKGGSNWLAKGHSAISLASKAYNMAKMLAALINVEYKFIDTTPYTLATVSNTGTIFPLTLSAQGATQSTRNGNSIKAKSISVKIGAVMGASITTQRYILFIDKVTSGVTPSITELLVADGVFTRYNDDYAGSRFQILSDRKIALGFNDTTNKYTGGPTEHNTSLFHKLSHHVKYDGTTAVIGDCTTGHLFLYVVATTNAQSTTTVNTRFEYIDN